MEFSTCIYSLERRFHVVLGQSDEMFVQLYFSKIENDDHLLICMDRWSIELMSGCVAMRQVVLCQEQSCRE